MKNHELIYTSIFVLLVHLLCSTSSPVLAQSYAATVEEKKLEAMASRKYSEYMRLDLAEQEALEDGNESDATLYRKAKQDAFDKYSGLSANLQQAQSSTKERRYRETTSKDN